MLVYWNKLTKVGMPKNLKRLFYEFKKERLRFRLFLLDISLNEFSKIELHVLVRGIKNQIIKYSAEDIVYNDNLLSEFSPYDVRAITYLSFQRFIKFDDESLILISGQSVRQGKTVFKFFNSITKEEFTLNAKEAYQDYNLLNKISRKDMINVVSTAVQEQSLHDFKNIG